MAFTVADDFEDGNLTEYTEDDDGSGGTWAANQDSPVYNGSYSLKFSGATSFAETWVYSTSGLDAYLQAGGTLECFGHWPSNSTWRLGFMGADPENQNHVNLARGGNTFDLIEQESGTKTVIASASNFTYNDHEDQWNKFTVETQTDGTVTVKFDSGDSGTTDHNFSGTFDNTGSNWDSDYLAWGNNAGSGRGLEYDYARVDNPGGTTESDNATITTATATPVTATDSSTASDGATVTTATASPQTAAETATASDGATVASAAATPITATETATASDAATPTTATATVLTTTDSTGADTAGSVRQTDGSAVVETSSGVAKTE